MELVEEKISKLTEEYDKLKQELSDTAIFNDQQRYKTVSKRFNELNEIINLHREITGLESNLQDNEELSNSETDPEMVELIRDEQQQLNQEYETKRKELVSLLLPKDPNNEKNAIVEIRAGTGGEEAALFAADLFRMYSYYAERKKWKLKVLSANETGLGGYKEVVFSLEGSDVYGNMRFESGVHRVQRVPDTESSGRIHTSAISVAVLPEAEPVDVQIEDKDLKVDVYRSSGCGGQSVNTTDSAVRITHIPTGIVVTCQDEKSQIKNKNKAMSVLRAKILDSEIAKQEQETSSARKSQVGTGDRSAKIRTYNFAQSRVTDHRINLTLYKLEQILNGDLDEFTNALKLAHKNEMMKKD